MTVPILTDHFATLAPNYDAVLSDVWGVVHNGVAATPPACEALTRFRKQGRTVVLISNAPRPGAQVRRFLDNLRVPHSAYDAIVSIGEVAEHPAIVKRKVQDKIEPYCAELKTTTRRQDNPPAYFPYGVAYMVKTETLLRERSFYPARATFFEIRRYQTYEIDDIYDFLCVEAVMKHEWGIA